MIKPDKVYLKYKNAWDRADDCNDGQDAIKAGGAKYLPKTRGMEIDQCGDELYKHYLEQAVFYNFSGRTLDSMVGVVCSKPADRLLPAYFDDVQFDGTDLDSFVRDRVYNVLSKYRDGVLIDWDVDKPAVKHYPAQTILSTFFDDKLYAVTLEENITEYIQGEIVYTNQRRKLALINNEYHSQVWRVNRDGEWVMIQDAIPLKAGYPLDYIPFVFFTPSGDKTQCDYSTMNDIYTLNIAHYRNSADYENLNRDIGHPTPCVSGLNVAASRTPQGFIATGTGSILQFDPGGQWGYLEHSGSSPAELRLAMDNKLAIAAALGARIIAGERREAESAEAQTIRNSGERGVLSVAAQGVSKSTMRMLEIMADWAGVQGDIAYTLRPDTGLADLGYEKIKAMLELDLAGYKIPDADFFRVLKEHKIIAEDTAFEDWAAGRVDG